MKRILLAAAFAALFPIGALADAVPTFPGGETALQSYITENLKYPATAAEMGIEGVVNLQFTVKADGTVGAIKVLRMIDPDLEAEAIRLVKGMPAWTPADEEGKPVDRQVELPITFRLPE